MKLKTALLNIPGWSTRRKIVVFQSDDWFAIRTSSQSALDALHRLGCRVDDCHYMRFDHLETSEDLEAMFGVLDGFVDANGRRPVFTANCLAANPDFEKIEQSDFSRYHSESSLSTAESTPGCERNLAIWRQGISQGVCFPQSHGREHLNVPRWMRALQSREPIAMGAFSQRMFGVSSHTTSPPRASVMAALDYRGDEGEPKESVVSGGLEGFRRMFGYESKSFIAPNYVWDDEVENAAQSSGVDFLQSGRVQWFPADGTGAQKHRRQFQGGKNKFGQRYVVRNVDFEPSSDPRIDWVNRTLSMMDTAFTFRKPAVISTHRVNFVGGLNPGNRDQGLAELKSLLVQMLKRWPDIEFLNTVELGDLISGRGSLS